MLLRPSVVGIVLLAAFSLTSATVRLQYNKDLIVQGKSFSISCTITNEQFVGWYKGGNKIPLDVTKRIHVKNPSAGEYALTVTNVIVQDGGDFVCRGNKEAKTFTLQVEFVAGHIKAQQYLRLGTTDTIKIDVHSYPSPTFTWKKNDKTFNANTGRFSSQNGGTVKVTKVEIADQGNYTCRISMLEGRRRKDIEIQVIVFAPPRMVAIPLPMTRFLTVGFNTTFHCHADGYPEPRYQWFNPIMKPIDTYNPRFAIDGEYFYITDVQLADVGKYTCVATNIKDFEARASASINEVYVRATIKDMYDEIVEMDERALLDCVGEGIPLPEVRWMRDGRYEKRQQIYSRRSVIRIPDVQMNDMGRYMCEARNKARDQQGNPIVATETVGLYIRTLPILNVKGTPLTVYSYLGNPKPVFIRCRFEGYPFPNVTIWFDNIQIANGTDFAMFDIITNELEDFGDYLCWSWNIHGSKNVTVQLTHAMHPGRPRNVRANVTCDSVVLTWDPPKDDGGMLIVHYIVEYGGDIWNTEDTFPEYYIYNLRKGKEYNIKLRARNKMGKGDYEAVRIITKKYCPPGRPIIWYPYDKIIHDRAFFLRWREPENNGGDPNVRYKVVVSEDLDDGPFPIKTELTGVKEFFVDGLKAGMRYELSVSAYNQGGTSKPAIAFYSIPSTVVKGRRDGSSAIKFNILTIFIAALVAMARLT